MKKTILLSLSLLAISVIGFTQYVPNGDFENWEDRFYYEIPAYNFSIVHTNVYSGGFDGRTPNITKVKGEDPKNTAVRLETTADSTNGILLLGQI